MQIIKLPQPSLILSPLSPPLCTPNSCNPPPPTIRPNILRSNIGQTNFVSYDIELYVSWLIICSLHCKRLPNKVLTVFTRMLYEHQTQHIDQKLQSNGISIKKMSGLLFLFSFLLYLCSLKLVCHKHAPQEWVKSL